MEHAVQPAPGSPVDRLLTWSTVASLALTLVSSVVYTLAGWADPTGALLHILGGAIGPFVVVRVVAHLWGLPWLAAAVLFTGFAGSAGVVGYGFNTVGVGLGGVDLIDATGVAVVLKPLGLFWPLSMLLVGIGLLVAKRAPGWCGIATVLGAVLYPISRIANIGWLAILADLVLLVALGAVAVLVQGEQRVPATTRTG